MAIAAFHTWVVECSTSGMGPLYAWARDKERVETGLTVGQSTNLQKSPSKNSLFKFFKKNKSEIKMN